MKEMLLGINKNADEYEHPYADRFLGEVPVTDLINGDELASQIGLTAGEAQFSDEPWLKFNLEGKTLYVAKKPYRYNISWERINAANAVYGDRSIEINGESFKVRLLKGAASDPISGGSDRYDPEQSWGSEWNRLFYPLVPNPTNTPTHPISQEGIRYGEWANYTEAELNIRRSGGAGNYTWCQETNANNASSRVYCGGFGISNFGLIYSFAATSFGWRPVLELIED